MKLRIKIEILFSPKQLFNKIVSLKVDLKKEVDEKIEAYEEQLNNDQLLDKINSIFDKKVGLVLTKRN